MCHVISGQYWKKRERGKGDDNGGNKFLPFIFHLPCCLFLLFCRTHKESPGRKRNVSKSLRRLWKATKSYFSLPFSWLFVHCRKKQRKGKRDKVCRTNQVFVCSSYLRFCLPPFPPLNWQPWRRGAGEDRESSSKASSFSSL